MLELVESMPIQIRESLELSRIFEVRGDVQNIVICGMGASGITGDIIKNLGKDSKVPIEVVKDFSVPGYVSAKTLAFVVSYSGDTHEVLSAFKELYRKGAILIVVTTGGKLKFAAEQAGVEHQKVIVVPRGLPPRQALPYLTIPILMTLHNLKIIQLSVNDIKETVEAVSNKTFVEKAKLLANHIGEKTPLIIASSKYSGVTTRWCTQINENAKTFAFAGVIPEITHNMILGFSRAPKNYHVVILSDEKDEPLVQKQMNIVKDIIKQSGMGITEIGLKGRSHMVKYFTAIFVGDLVSVMLAKKAGVNAMDTRIIEELKKKL